MRKVEHDAYPGTRSVWICVPALVCGSTLLRASGDRAWRELRESIDRLQADAERVRGWLKEAAPMPTLTDEQEADFQAATHCWICEKEFVWYDDSPHRDH